MGNAKLNNWMQWVLLVGIIASLLCSYGAYNKDIDIPENTYPTASEIASLVVIPEVVIPKIVTPEVRDIDNDRLNNIWDVFFKGCSINLEVQAEEDAEDEVESELDDLEEFIEENIDRFDELVGSLDLDEDETKITIIELGECIIDEFNYEYESDEDKEVEVIFKYDFTYEDTSDNTNHKDSVYVTVNVRYDEDDLDDIESIEVSYSL